jgi:hypothetical protein
MCSSQGRRRLTMPFGPEEPVTRSSDSWFVRVARQCGTGLFVLAFSGCSGVSPSASPPLAGAPQQAAVRAAAAETVAQVMRFNPMDTTHSPIQDRAHVYVDDNGHVLAPPPAPGSGPFPPASRAPGFNASAKYISPQLLKGLAQWRAQHPPAFSASTPSGAGIQVPTLAPQDLGRYTASGTHSNHIYAGFNWAPTQYGMIEGATAMMVLSNPNAPPPTVPLHYLALGTTTVGCLEYGIEFISAPLATSVGGSYADAGNYMFVTNWCSPATGSNGVSFPRGQNITQVPTNLPYVAGIAGTTLSSMTKWMYQSGGVQYLYLSSAADPSGYWHVNVQNPADSLWYDTIGFGITGSNYATGNHMWYESWYNDLPLSDFSYPGYPCENMPANTMGIFGVGSATMDGNWHYVAYYPDLVNSAIQSDSCVAMNNGPIPASGYSSPYMNARVDGSMEYWWLAAPE